jgi:hypothetical protein
VGGATRVPAARLLPPTALLRRIADRAGYRVLAVRRPGRGGRRPPQARAQLLGHGLDHLPGAAVLGGLASLLEPADDHDSAARAQLTSLSIHQRGFDIGGAGGGLAGSLAGGVHHCQGQLGSGDQDLSLAKPGPSRAANVRDEVVAGHEVSRAEVAMGVGVES